MWYQFHDRMFVCDAGAMWQCTDGYVSGDQVLALYGMEDTDPKANFAVLVAMVVVYRVLAAVWMYYFHTGKK